MFDMHRTHRPKSVKALSFTPVKYSSDIRKWMIANKLKINDMKTYFIVFRSPQLKCDLSDLIKVRSHNNQ